MLGPTPRPGRRKRKRQSKSVAAPRVSAIKEREEKPPTPAEDGDWDLLPQCPGPKLGPFLPKPTNIQYVEYISDPEESGDSCVFEVLIHGKRYALKVVNTASKHRTSPRLIDPVQVPRERILRLRQLASHRPRVSSGENPRRRNSPYGSSRPILLRMSCLRSYY